MSEYMDEESNASLRGGSLRRITRVISRTLGAAAGLVLIFMMVATLADVARRTFTGRPIPGVTELGEVLMVTAVYLGLAYAESKDAHVRVTLFIEKLTPRVAAVLNSLGLLLVLVMAAWMAWLTGGRAIESIETNELRFGLVEIPVWPARLAIVLGFLSFFFALFPRIIDQLRRAYAGSPNPEGSTEGPLPGVNEKRP